MWLLTNGQWFPPLVMTATGEILFLGLSYSNRSIIAESQISDIRNTRHPAVAGYPGQWRAFCVPFRLGPSVNQNHSGRINNVVTNRNYSPLNDNGPGSWS
ncbi:uncharacterized protein METZ01_LOCUS303417, partial [marine metagenome]